MVVLVSLIYFFVLICVGAAEIISKRAVASHDIHLLNVAQRLYPFVSDYFYAEYRLNGNLSALVHAMSLEPTKPAYHMYYGLALLKRLPRRQATDQEAVTEICKAAQLKPYSQVYRSACEQYRAAIPISTVF